MSDSRRQRDKSGSVFIGRADDKFYSARVSNDFTDGHRGMARAIKGAKKFVRSRIRARNKVALRREVNELEP